MSNYLSSPHYKKWKKKSQLRYLKLAIAANLFHLVLIILGVKRLIVILQLLPYQSAIQYSLEEKEQIRQVKRVVNPIFKRIRKSKYLWANCLSSSILLWFILKRQGLEPNIIIGTEKDKGQFKAHAWVEYNNFPLNEHKKVRENYHAFNHKFQF